MTRPQRWADPLARREAIASTTVHKPNPLRRLAEQCEDDFGRFCYEGFGVLLDDQQLEARAAMGPLGPRLNRMEPKYTFLSGGQRGGKTVYLALAHFDACLYKRGVRRANRQFWDNYLYKTLALAPSTEATMKMWSAMDMLQKHASDAQWDRHADRPRKAAFLHLIRIGKHERWPAAFFRNGSIVNFRSSEGYAVRLEGDQWWGVTWDEWASQPDREIGFVKSEVLLGRARDHDAKIWLAAWPKKTTERHLMKVIREIEEGTERDAQVVYINAERSYFTNQDALDVEKRTKGEAEYKRTVLGEPAGGSGVEFPWDVLTNMFRKDLTLGLIPDDQDFARYRYFTSWDLGAAWDATVGVTWQLPRIGVDSRNKARIVNFDLIPGAEGLTIDTITSRIAANQRLYRSDVAVDASSMGGVLTIRQLRGMKPPPMAFVARGNDRRHGNLRMAIIANGLEQLTWGRPTAEEEQGWRPVPDEPNRQRRWESGTWIERPAPVWGHVESPMIPVLQDQLSYFDREEKDLEDDAVMAFLIGLWYIRLHWLASASQRAPMMFDQRVAR